MYHLRINGKICKSADEKTIARLFDALMGRLIIEGFDFEDCHDQRAMIFKMGDKYVGISYDDQETHAVYVGESVRFTPMFTIDLEEEVYELQDNDYHTDFDDYLARTTCQ